MPSEGKDVVCCMFRDGDLKLSCGPVLKVKMEDLEMCCFKKKCRKEFCLCLRWHGISSLLAPGICCKPI